MNTIIEESRSIPLSEEFDVIVAGGGIAGVSAALAASREGKKVLLLERGFTLGGLATAGLVTIYLPLCDGKGHQVSFGIAEELLRLSISLGYESGESFGRSQDAGAWLQEGREEERKQERFEAEFNAQVFAILLERKLLEAGVSILYGTIVTAAKVDNEKITAVFCENKSGRRAFSAASYIDATGDADLAWYAGAETAEYTPGNALASWYYEYIESHYQLRMTAFCDLPQNITLPGESSPRGTRYRGLDGEEISRFVCDSHLSTLASFLKNGGVSGEHAIATMATIPQFRMTRRIVGLHTEDEEDAFRIMPTSVGMISDWRKAGPVFEVPFGVLVSRNIHNLLACGRCISVSDALWDVSRVIPCCAVTGEACGRAVAIADDFHQLHRNIDLLQQNLRKNSIPLHTYEVLE